MSAPLLTPDQITEVSDLVAGYITDQREKALPHAVPLSSEQRASLDSIFLPQVLDTRLLVLGETRVENPTFYPMLRQMGFTNLPNFSTMAAVTFCDVVVSHQAHAGRAENEGVALLTYFKAKGRQWHTVILTTCNQGLIPHKRAPVEDERRLFYVAMTRASANLMISYVGKSCNNKVKPSQFLGEGGLI